jgi:two-component system, LytTR family, response regulator
MINAIIVDDEERGIVALQKLIERYCEGINIAGVARNIETAAELIRNLKPYVVFLDIEMPGGNGFALLDMFEKIDFEIIFVTAFHEYAVKAIRFAALDYLLKPVKIEELQAAVKSLEKKKGKESNAAGYSLLQQSMNSINAFNKIILNTSSNYFFVNLEDILYCKAEDNYTWFIMKNNDKHMISKQLKEYEELFGDHNFFRIHKSYLINMNQVIKVNKKEGASVVMANKDELPVSFRKKDHFFDLLKSFQ